MIPKPLVFLKNTSLLFQIIQGISLFNEGIIIYFNTMLLDKKNVLSKLDVEVDPPPFLLRISRVLIMRKTLQLSSLKH